MHPNRDAKNGATARAVEIERVNTHYVVYIQAGRTRSTILRSAGDRPTIGEVEAWKRELEKEGGEVFILQWSSFYPAVRKAE